jgi:hypothetical protein
MGTAASGQPAPWAHHSNGSADPQLASTTDTSSGGSGAPFARFSRRNRLYFGLKARVHVKSLQLGIV